MNYLKKDLGTIGPDDIVEATLDHAANVQLLDPSNYQAYESGRKFTYHGGHVTKSPFRIRCPYLGHWYLVIDLGGAPGTVRAGVRVLANVS
jgi:Domain of unknown function (DUF1883)